MISFFKKLREERKDLTKAINSLAERLEDLEEYRKDLPAILLESAEELGGILSASAETLRRIEIAMSSQVKANEAIARYFKYEIGLLEKQNEELGKAPGRHDDIF